MKYCEYCGKAIGDNAAFCSGCGKSCQGAAPVRTFCENCGRPLEADQRFCQGCGKPVGSVPIPVAPVQPVPVTPVQPVPTAPVQPDPAAQFVLQPAPRTVPQSMPQPMPQPIPQPMPQPIPQPMPQPASQPVYPVPVQPVQPEYNTPAPVTAKKRKMPKWVMAVTAVVLVAAIGLGIFALCGGFIKRADFPRPLTEESWAEFIDTVLDNTGGEIAIQDIYVNKITDKFAIGRVLLAKVAGEELLVTNVINALGMGKAEGERTYSLTVANITGVHFDQGETEYNYKEQYDMGRELAIALEKTLAGKSQVGRYVKEYSEMQQYAAECIRDTTNSDGEYWEKDMANYWLNDKIEVVISIGGSLRSNLWGVSYSLRIHP